MAEQSKIRRWAPWGISAVLALAFTMTGMSKLTGNAMMVEAFAN